MSGAVDRIREQRGMPASDRRYIREETPSLEEISNPDTLRDERKKTRLEWAGENPWLVLLGAIFTVFGLGLVVYLTTRYSPSALSTLYGFRGILGAVVGIGIGSVLGMRHLQTKMRSWDQLTIKTSENRAKRYYGYYLESDLGEFPIFVPIAGFDRWGNKANLYKIADISRQIVRKRGAPWQEDDPAIMRLDPNWTAVSHTDSGTVIVTVCDGFEPDDQGRETNLAPITPTEGSKERLKDMSDDLEKARKQKEHLESMVDKLQRQIGNLLEDMDKPIEEKMDEYVTFYERVEEARAHRGNRSRDDDEQEGIGPQAELPSTGDDDA